MNALERKLRRRIALSGPLTVEQFMAAALSDPEHGYYMRRDPFGAAGDFITAPEISQMFGEIVGLWCAVTWRQMGRPSPTLLVELGPGRGTLMKDALRALAGVPDVAACLRVHLVETSPTLRRIQERTLKGHVASWHDSVADLPPGPLVLLANEFFDALPIRQLVRTEAGWRERVVKAGPGEGPLRFAAGPSAAEALLAPAVAAAPPGSIAELCPAALALGSWIGERLCIQGGAALVIDYGHAASAAGETLQAVKSHKPHPVLADPGEVDLTAHVDFERLARAARGAGARCYGPVPQGEFLKSLGIEARARALSAKAAPPERAALESALARLTDAKAMGSLFKALAIAAPGLPPLAGFEAWAEWQPPPGEAGGG